MADSVTKRTIGSRMLYGLHTPPCSPGAKATALRGHLQNLLDELPQDLPTYYHEALLDDLCFLLDNPLFLYAVGPRIRRGKQTPASSPIKTTTTRVPMKIDLRNRAAHDPKTKINTSNLRMEIKRDNKGWVTRLLYNTATLIEGRQYSPPKDTDFVPSFQFFCEEVEFLGYEFRAREHAAAVACGMAVDDKTRKGDAESALGADEKKKRRLVKLKVRFKMARGKVRRVTK